MTPKKAIIVGSLSGMIAFGVTILVNSYYNQLIGWSLGYGFNSLTGGYMDSSISTGEFFASYIQNPSNLIFYLEWNPSELQYNLRPLHLHETFSVKL